MSFPLLHTALLMPLELGVNGLLALDPASKPRLARIAGKTLTLHVRNPAMTLHIGATGKGLHLSVVHEGVTDASLHGRAADLLKLLVRREPVSNLLPLRIELRGDTAFVQDLQNLLLRLDIDWEYHLSRLIGDLPTQTFSTGLHETGAALRRTGSKLKADASDFLMDEIHVLPAASEMESFYDALAALVLRTDRLQARLERLQKKP